MALNLSLFNKKWVYWRVNVIFWELLDYYSDGYLQSSSDRDANLHTHIELEVYAVLQANF